MKLADQFIRMRVKHNGEHRSKNFKRELRKWFVSQGYQKYYISPENERNGKDVAMNKKAYRRTLEMYESRFLSSATCA